MWPSATQPEQLTLLEMPSAEYAPHRMGVTDADLKTRLMRTAVDRIRLKRLAMRGINASEAAKIIGCHAETARTHYSDPAFRHEVTDMVDSAFAGTDAAFLERTKSLTERLEEQAGKSFQALIDMLDPNTHGGRLISDNLAFRIHTGFLDRHGETAAISKSHISLDPMELTIAAKAAREMESGPVLQLVRKSA